MEISMTLNGYKKLILTPKSENWKKYAELIESGERYEVIRENNSASIILRQIKQEPPVSTLNLNATTLKDNL